MAITETEIVYSDIAENFEQHPVTKDVAMAINAQAVKNSLLALLLTDKGERPYQPNTGGNISGLLFENVDFITAHSLERAIFETISNEEPRAVVEQIIVDPNPSRNEYNVKIIFYVINDLTNKLQIETTLERQAA